MWKKKQQYYLASLELTDGSSIVSPVSAKSARTMTTIAMGREARASSPTLRSTPGNPALASLFASPNFPTKHLDDILEEEDDDAQ